ncbi:MAG: hypothetical protein KDD50_10700 [Bdellovibrionales bacterium]|nr:hypothetical protein [Bdellovibrionales bacterium]
MASVTQFSNFIMHLQGHRDLSLITLNNFLKYYPINDDQFDSNLIHQFFLYAFRHKYWQQNKEPLFNAIFTATNNFVKQNYLNTDLQPLLFWKENKIFDIHNHQDQQDVLNQFFRFKTAEPNVNLLELDNDRTLMLQVLDGQRLNIKVFGPYFYLKHGLLTPILPYSDLFYSPEMELDTNKAQTLEIENNVFLHGVFSNGLWRGQIIRGYTLQKYSGLNMGKLTEFPEVFRALKKLEINYINLETDPDYLKLKATIEKSIQILESNGENCLEIAMKNMIRVEKIRKQLFPNDKSLKYLISTLEVCLLRRMKQAPQVSEYNAPKEFE